MTRFQKRPTPLVYTALVSSIAAVAIADFFAPLGIAVWVFYLVPIVISLHCWHKSAPLVVAALATALIVGDFWISPPGELEAISRGNRAFGILTIWIVAGMGYQFLRNKLAKRKEEWLQSGGAGLNNNMAGDQRIDELAENVLRFLATYLDAQAGAVFVEDTGHFRRCATYAVPASAQVPERFASGEGLLGQAVRDDRTFVLQNLTDDYLMIGSGLGQSRPRHLMITPIKVDRAIIGVLELGFFHSIHDSDKELLVRSSQSIGIALRSAKYRARLHELLEETQRQSEELQAQSEELRVSNEELEEQSRGLKESQTRLELQQTELEQTNVQLEEQTRFLETQKNELSRSKAELEAQARALDQASRYKSDFLANMSHELRTPLNSSLILAKLLADNRDGNLTAEQIKYAKTIQSAGNDLLVLINDVLDLSKIEAGRMEINPETIRPARVLESLRASFEPLATQKRLKLEMRLEAGAPESLETDAQRLEQVLKNLLSNAIKFTEKGKVTLTVGCASDGQVAFSVGDTGIGIAEHQQHSIFEPFCQADGTTNRKYGGTGLGLSISRELVRLLGGHIHLTSEAGRGSTFTVTVPQVFHRSLARSRSLEPEPSSPRQAIISALPRERLPAPTAPAPTLPDRATQVADDREHLSHNGRIILIIEDDESFARILSDLGHELQFQSLIAATGEEALTLAQQYRPSAVILDIGLPDSSGLAVLDRLKRDSRTRHIPVHVVSASDYAETALALGAVGYMLKPVKREQLVEAFEKLEVKLTQKLRRVLLVEDDPVQLDSLRQLLGSHAVETVGVQTAAECLDVLKTTTFDCMVLDLSLPDASGFSLLETLSQEDAYAFPPVIVYTGRELAVDEEQQLRRYSKSIIIKGAKSPERLLDEVTLFLHQVVSELPAEQQRMLERARSRDEVLEGRRILVVEDDVRNIFALTSLLEPQGVLLQIARNGREAIEALERSRENPQHSIDLVLMDIMMPEMDGHTAMREIRKRPEWKKLPIIALTAKAMKNDQEQALQAGANDYMAKPLDVEKLLSLVRVWMPR